MPLDRPRAYRHMGAVQDNINKIVLTALEYTRDANGIRAANAFEVEGGRGAPVGRAARSHERASPPSHCGETPLRARVQTLALMFRGICTKNFNNFTFDIIDLLTGIDRAEDAFRVRAPAESAHLARAQLGLTDKVRFRRGAVCDAQELVTVINDALRSRTLAVPQKRAALHLLCVMLTTTENLNANSLVQYLMHPSLFETLLHVW